MDELLHEDKHKNIGYTEYSFQQPILEHLQQYHVFHILLFLLGMYHLLYLQKHLLASHRLFVH